MWNMLIPAAATLGSAFIGSRAASSAANTQAAAADRSAEVQREIYQQQRADLEPWRTAGVNALAPLVAATGQSYTQSPGYDFRFGQGLRAIDNAASARGMVGSGARDKALMRFGQGVAADDYNNWWNRQASLAGIGQTATGQGNELAGAYGANLAGIYGQGANAQAAGQIGQANAVTNALTNGLTLYGQYFQPRK
jgi:hypothetical protein